MKIGFVVSDEIAMINIIELVDIYWGYDSLSSIIYNIHNRFAKYRNNIIERNRWSVFATFNVPWAVMVVAAMVSSARLGNILLLSRISRKREFDLTIYTRPPPQSPDYSLPPPPPNRFLQKGRSHRGCNNIIYNALCESALPSNGGETEMKIYTWIYNTILNAN